MAIAPDRAWMVVGTAKGYVSLWDVRYNAMCRLWRHSSSGPIHRLATCKSLPVGSKSEQAIGSPEGAFLFVAAGSNEAAVWAIPEGGECLKCFRSIPLRSSREPLAPLPVLQDISLPRHPQGPIVSAVGDYATPNLEGGGDAHVHSYRALLGRISEKGTSYLVTAGTDKCIRYWDFSHPSRCFTVTGLLPCQPRPSYEASGVGTKLFLSHDTAVPSAEATTQAHLPLREGRGPLQPPTNFKVHTFLSITYSIYILYCIL